MVDRIKTTKNQIIFYQKVFKIIFYLGNSNWLLEHHQWCQIEDGTFEFLFSINQYQQSDLIHQWEVHRKLLKWRKFSKFAQSKFRVFDKWLPNRLVQCSLSSLKFLSQFYVKKITKINKRLKNLSAKGMPIRIKITVFESEPQFFEKFTKKLKRKLLKSGWKFKMIRIEDEKSESKSHF